jgi:hypothetical protein
MDNTGLIPINPLKKLEGRAEVGGLILRCIASIKN